MAGKLTSTDEIVGSRLRLRRKQYAASERQLARILGVRVAKIQEYESGAARLDATRLGKAGDALDVPIGYFFAPLGSIDSSLPDALPAERILATPGAGDLLSAYSRIASSQLRDVVLKLVQRLARESRGCVSPTLVKAPSPARHSSSRAR